VGSGLDTVDEKPELVDGASVPVTGVELSNLFDFLL